uniref:Uncharacterized protein n=1 Tax=viral metagenome TaxID=1070528 RepID=A0A6C0HDY9_9ZZZZ
MNVIEVFLVIILICLLFKLFYKPQVKYNPEIIHPASL